MKTKLRRHYRSAVSVLLSVCILMSCVAVGLIGTDAALVTGDDAVGARVDDESVGNTASGTVYADGNLKGDGDWISLPMYYDTASGNYYCPASIKDGGEWKFHDSSAKYGSQKDDDSYRDISEYGSESSNYEVVTSGRESTFRLKKGSTVDCTVWLKGDLTSTWVTEGKTAPPTVTVSLAANPTNVTAKVTNSSTTITAGSSGSLVIGSESTIHVTVDSSVRSTKKAVSATVTTSDSSETVYFASNGDGTYTATFEVPSKAATVTVNPLEDKQTYKVKVVANDPSYGSVSVTSAGGAAYNENLRYAEDTPIVLSATAAADHPFQSWDKGTDKTNAAATYYVNGNDADEDNDEVITITAIFKSNYYKASSTIVGDTSKVFQGITARFFDYYYDTEVKEGWLQYTNDDAKDDNQQPYTILNQALKTYASANSVPVPLYFGNMYDSYNGMYGNQTPANVTGVTSGQNSTDYHYYKAANNSNGIKDLYGIGDNYDYGTALTGLSGKNLNSSGNITHVSDKDSQAADSEVEMKLFDKDWLTSRSGDGYAYTGPLATIIDSPFPFVKETIKRVYFDSTGEYTYVYTWSGNGATEVRHNGSWPGTPLLTDTATGKKYINVSTDAEYFILNNGSDSNKTDTLNFNWASGNCYNVSGSSWSTVTDNDKGNYYSFDSKGGQDNAYFTGIRDGEVSPVMNYYKNRNKVHDRVGDPNNTYGFFPFDGNLAGTNAWALDYGYGMRMDIEFTLGENGKNPLGQDQIFKFSGDDDLWVYIDGKLVLDLGGAHGRSTGEINFAYTTGVDGATDTTNNTTVTVDAVKSMYSTAQNAGTNTTALPPVHYTNDSNKGVTRNGTASVDRTKQKHTMTIFYMERGKHESNLKIGFSFSPVANDFVAEKDLNLNRVSANEDFKTAVETLANTDQFTFNNSWSATSGGPFNAPASGLASTFTHNGASSVKTTGETTQIPDASTKFTAGDSDSFVGKFTVGQYFKLTETPDSSNKFNYDDRLTVTDMAQNDKRLTPVDAENGIYKFDTVKTAPDYEIDPVLIKATHTNTLKTRSLSIKKEISGDPDATTTFPIQVKIKLDKTAEDSDANYVAYKLPYVKSDSTSGTLDSDGKVSLKQNETITIEGIPENASVRVSEPDALSNDYHQASCVVKASDDSSVSTTPITNGMQFAIGSKDINVVITNSVKEQTIKYRITYSYTSRTQYVPTEKSMYGQQKFFVEDTFKFTGTSEWFQNGNITKKLVQDKAPYEDNFMRDTELKDENITIKDSQTVGTETVYIAEATFTEVGATQKIATFKFPYNYKQGVQHQFGTKVYYADGTEYLGENEDNWFDVTLRVDYQTGVYAWDVVKDPITNKDKTVYFFTTAPDTLTNGGNFLYWSIRSKNRYTGEDEEVARCYDTRFNYIIFDDYTIIPVYSGFDSSKYDVSENTQSTDTKYATVNLLDYSRNQWNSNTWNETKEKGNGSLKADSMDGRDTVYVDLDVAFSYNNLKIKGNAKSVKSGILVENCGKLDSNHLLNIKDETKVNDGSGNQITRYQADYNYYVSKYDTNKTEMETKLKDYLANGMTADDANDYLDYAKEKYANDFSNAIYTSNFDMLKTYSTNNSLNDMNRAEIAIGNHVRVINNGVATNVGEWTIDEVKKQSLFRAYTYIVGENGEVILSEPIYFTVYNTANL